MGISFKELPAEQQERFHASCRRGGIDPDSVREFFSTQQAGGAVAVGHPGGNTAFPPDRILDVSSVSDLRALYRGGGREDALGSTAGTVLRYPPPAAGLGIPDPASFGGDTGRLRSALTRQQFLAISEAFHAYLNGDPERVAEYEPLIDALHFPKRIPVFVVKDMVITAGNPLIVNDPGNPTSLVLGTLTIEEGGYIEASSELDINVSVLTVLGS